MRARPILETCGNPSARSDDLAVGPSSIRLRQCYRITRVTAEFVNPSGYHSASPRA